MKEKELDPHPATRLLYQICFLKCKFTFNHPRYHPVRSLPVITQRYKGAEQFHSCQKCPWIFQRLADVNSNFSAYKEGGPLYKTPPNLLHAPIASAGFPLLSTRRREALLLFIFQHHGQRSNCPPRGRLLLRLPVARSCRGLLTGDTLVGFPPENPTGEGPGERFLEGTWVCLGCWALNFK